jgi:hypothetical protein
MNRLALVAVAVLLLPLPAVASPKEPAAPKTITGKVVGVTDAPEKKPAADAAGKKPDWWTLIFQVGGGIILLLAGSLMGYCGRWFQEKVRRIYVFVENLETHSCTVAQDKRLLPCLPPATTHLAISFMVTIFSEKTNPLFLRNIRVEFAEKRSWHPKILATAPMGTEIEPIGRTYLDEIQDRHGAEVDVPSRQSVKMSIQGWVQEEEVRAAEKCRAAYLSAETPKAVRMRWWISDLPPRKK